MCKCRKELEKKFKTLFMAAEYLSFLRGLPQFITTRYETEKKKKNKYLMSYTMPKK